MILLVTHSRRFLFLLSLAFIFGILFLSFVPNDHGYGYYNTPPPSPPTTAIHVAPASPTDPNCDPFALNTHLYLNESSPMESFFQTFDPLCRASTPNWISQLAELGPNDPPLEALKDKTILFLGDSVDRFLLHDLCVTFNGTFNMHDLDGYRNITTEAYATGGLPRSCTIDGPSGLQGLTLLNYFFYGYDEDDMWRDKNSTWSWPPNYTDRWNKFEFEAYPSAFGPDGILAGTPAGKKGYPDLVIINMGLWELARFDRLDEQKHKNEDPDTVQDPLTLEPAFVDEYIKLTVEFLAKVRRLVGDDSRIRWRQMHTPTIASGPYFKDPTGKKRKSRGRFTPVKIKVLNEAAGYACVIASENEFERRRREHEGPPPPHATQNGGWGVWNSRHRQEDDDNEMEEQSEYEDGRITVWPIGDLIAPWPAKLWLRDDIHPTEHNGMVAWGGGVFEYLARAPKGRPRRGDDGSTVPVGSTARNIGAEMARP